MTKLQRFLLLVVLVGTLILATATGWNAFQRAQFRVRFNDVFAALQEGDLQATRLLLRDIQGESNWRSHTHLLRGALALRTGNPATAIYEFAAVGGEQELRTPLLLLQAEALFAAGRIVESESVLQLLISEAPDLPDAHRLLSAVYHQRGAMEAAQVQLLQVTRLVPDHYLAWRQLGMIYQRDLANNIKAIECYENALERNPPPVEHDAILRELAEALIFRRDYRSALAALKRVQRDNGRSLALKAECSASLNEPESARSLLKSALFADPNDRFALLLNAKFHMIDGNVEAAILDLKHALQIDPHDFTSRLSLAVAYQRLGDSEASRVELERMNLSKELRTDLTSMFVKAAKDPDDPEIREQIAEQCVKLGQLQLAESWRRAAEVSRQIYGVQ